MNVRHLDGKELADYRPESVSEPAQRIVFQRQPRFPFLLPTHPKSVSEPEKLQQFVALSKSGTKQFRTVPPAGFWQGKDT